MFRFVGIVEREADAIQGCKIEQSGEPGLPVPGSIPAQVHERSCI